MTKKSSSNLLPALGILGLMATGATMLVVLYVTSQPSAELRAAYELVDGREVVHLEMSGEGDYAHVEGPGQSEGLDSCEHPDTLPATCDIYLDSETSDRSPVYTLTVATRFLSLFRLHASDEATVERQLAFERTAEGEVTMVGTSGRLELVGTSLAISGAAPGAVLAFEGRTATADATGWASVEAGSAEELAARVGVARLLSMAGTDGLTVTLTGVTVRAEGAEVTGDVELDAGSLAEAVVVGVANERGTAEVTGDAILVRGMGAPFVSGSIQQLSDIAWVADATTSTVTVRRCGPYDDMSYRTLEGTEVSLRIRERATGGVRESTLGAGDAQCPVVVSGTGRVRAGAPTPAQVADAARRAIAP